MPSTLLLVWLLCWSPMGLLAQRPRTHGGSQAISDLRSELQRLESICIDLQLDQQAEICRSWLPPERNDRTLLYLPEPKADESATDSRVASWARHFNRARTNFAEALFDRAESLSRTEEAEAYRLLWQTLRNNSEHAAALRLLGPLVRGVKLTPRVVRARTAHSQLGWAPGSYSTLSTPHFRLVTRASTVQSLEIARQLEQFYVLWSQQFFELWAPPNSIANAFEKGAGVWPKHERHEVVLLADRKEYLEILGVAEENIGVSVGYYNPSAKLSFFFPDDNLQATFYHELTHQLLFEATLFRGRADAGQENGLWLIEGIALYMESLAHHGSYWTVGGIEAPRMQTARYRAVRDGFWPEWSEYASGGQQAWQSRADLAVLYSHAAGLAHAWLDLHPNGRENYIKALVACYESNQPGASLIDAWGQNEDQARDYYQDLLVIKSDQLEGLQVESPTCQELVLCGSQLEPAEWQDLQRLSKLAWLDVSFSNVRDDDLNWLANSQSLTRLSVEGTAAGAATVAAASQISALRELDLTGCTVDDAGLQSLRNHPNLEILWLGDTSITGASFSILESLPRLRQCDVSGSGITDPEWKRFLKANRQLQ